MQKLIMVWPKVQTMNPFDSDKPRIGLPALDKEMFKVPVNNPKKNGKREDIPEYLASLGYNAYEFAATRLAKLEYKKDMDIFKENAKKFDMFVSLHAPYYISPTNTDAEARATSIDRLVEVYRWCSWLGAKRIVLHPGGYMKLEPDEAVKVMINFIKDSHLKLEEKYPNDKSLVSQIQLCVETMGKAGQLGSVEETVRIVKEINKPYVAQCVDFGHLYTRHLGKIDEKKILEYIEKELGKNAVEQLHVHISKIEYSAGGEVEHVENANTQWGPDFNNYVKLLVENGYKHVIINETPLLQKDGNYLLDIYEKHAKKKIRD